MSMMLSAAAEAMHGVLHGEDRSFDGVSTDTRTLARNQLFLALSGPNFDGRDFVGQANEQGAAGAVVPSLVDEVIAQITVDDTRLALGRLGSAWREQNTATVVGITGSNGKTTLKELTAACLSAIAPTLATEGNLNNDIGMPLMLLRIDESHRYAVLEMGANHAGEIAYLASLAKPDVVVITNAGAAHLEGFSSIEGVAKAKGEILQCESRPDFAILNADDKYFDYWRSLVPDTKLISFGLNETADVRGDEIELESGRTNFCLHIFGDSVSASLALPGIHNVRNACAAAAIATALDVAPDAIAAALENVEPVAGRLQPVAGLNGATLYDDSYNANPLSVVAAGEFLASLPGDSWVVLGDMKELGADEARLHSEVGEKLRSAGIDRLYTTGDLCRNTSAAFGDRSAWFETAEELAAALAPNLSSATNILVKGSRSMRMERVIEALREPAAARLEV